MEIKTLSKINIETVLKNKNLLANLGVILIALIITRNLHVAQMGNINNLKGQIVQEEKIASFVDELKILEDRIDALERDFPTNLSSAVVIDMISSLVRKHVVKIISLDAQSSVDKKIYQQIPIKLNIEADFHKLGHFISEIENTEALKVEGLSMQSKDVFSSGNSMENIVQLSLIAISLKQK